MTTSTRLLVSLGAFVSLGGVLIACLSGSGGAVGDPCLGASDCANQYECVAAYSDGGCSSPVDGAAVLTCQQTCSSIANCQILGSNYTCSAPSCTQGTGVSGLCRLP